MLLICATCHVLCQFFFAAWSRHVNLILWNDWHLIFSLAIFISTPPRHLHSSSAWNIASPVIATANKDAAQTSVINGIYCICVETVGRSLKAVCALLQNSPLRTPHEKLTLRARPSRLPALPNKTPVKTNTKRLQQVFGHSIPRNSPAATQTDFKEFCLKTAERQKSFDCVRKNHTILRGFSRFKNLQRRRKILENLPECTCGW